MDAAQAEPTDVAHVLVSALTDIINAIERVDARTKAVHQILDTMQGVLATASASSIRTLWNPSEGLNAPGIVDSHLSTLGFDGPSSAASTPVESSGPSSGMAY